MMSRPRSDPNPSGNAIAAPNPPSNRHPSVRALDAETVDEIAAAAVSRGGSEALVRDQLLYASVRRSHNPVPVVESPSSHSPQGVLQSGAVPIASAPAFQPKNKVSIIGCGQVGLAIAYSLLNRNTVGALALVDVDEEKLIGEAMDLRQGSAFYSRVKIDASKDYAITADSDLVIVTAGTARRPGETRLDLVARNAGIVQRIIPKVLRHSPSSPICIVSNPADVMAAVAARAAEPYNLPPGRIFGSGCVLDSSRLRSLIASTFDVDTSSVNGFVIGEHGDSSVPVWSSISVGGALLIPPGGQPNEAHRAMHQDVVKSGAEVIRRKGHTNFAIGMSVARISEAVLNDERSFLPVSTCVRGYQGVKEDVFLSVPCCVGATGVVRVIDLFLTDDEADAFRNSAEKVWSCQESLWKDWPS